MKKHLLLIFLFGFTCILLKVESSLAEIRSTYYSFPAQGACYELGKDGSWAESNACSDQSIESYEISEALDSFCLYEVKGPEPLELITKKLGFLRPVERVNLSLTNSGSIVTSKFIRPGAKLLFYKGDILRANDTGLCRRPTKVDIKSSFYALSYPATFYVMRPFLKKTGSVEDPKEEEKDSIDDLRNIITRKRKKKGFSGADSFDDLDLGHTDKVSKLNLSVGFFFEEFDGTQKSNGSNAKILNELSPSFQMKYIPSKFNLAFNLQADLHIFDKNIGQLQILDEQVLNFSFFIESKFRLLSFMSLRTFLGISEDLYYIRQSASDIAFKKDLIPRLGLGLDIFLIQTHSLALGFSPQFYYDLEGDAYKSGVTLNGPVFVSFKNDGFNLNVEIGYTNRDKELTDLDLNYSRYFAALTLGIKI